MAKFICHQYLFSCEKEKDEWMTSLYGAINDDREKRKSIKRDQVRLHIVMVVQ